MNADVLIVTVTKVESKAVVEVFKEATGQSDRTIQIGDRMYHDLGTVNETRVFMVRSEMGTSSLGASQQTVQKGIAALSPAAVIMVGIAFGIDNKKQAIGDILVSSQLWPYELQRVGTNKEGEEQIIPRDAKPDASTWLINRFRTAELSWDESRARVRFGLLLSGQKLADNINFRQQLLQFEPEAIGGEMEGAGVYTACQDNKVDWILVKAICDWGDGNKGQDKDARQRLAAHNAAEFVLHMLMQAPLKPEMEHREPIALANDLSSPIPATVVIASQAGRSGLPRLPYFFGREKELGIISDALSPESRSWGVLIDGPGGIGKTALAIRAGHLAPGDHFPHKIFLSAKIRELTPGGEQSLEDYMLPNFMSLISELAVELGKDDIKRMPPNERANAVRRSLIDKQALIIIDNVETFDEKERVRLYQFLSRLPGTCKAIVTSRRRSDIDARIIRLDRLAIDEALDLIEELAKSNRHLSRATDAERRELYEITQGNPLLIKWVAGQLGRPGSNCRTVAEASEFMQSAPSDNDPLEYIFGDLLGTFTESEKSVLAALTHFAQPAKVEWIADLAGIGRQAAQTALEDLSYRAVLISDEQAESFLLPTLASKFLRRKYPEIVAQTGNRLTDRIYALVLENGYQKHELFPKLEAEWPAIAAALPLFLQGDNKRLHTLCNALLYYLEYYGHLDEELSLYLQAEEKALAEGDFHNAGWRAFQVGRVYQIRAQASDILASAARCKEHWQKAGAGGREKAFAIMQLGRGHLTGGNFLEAVEAFKEAAALERTRVPGSADLMNVLNLLAIAEQHSGDHAAAERHYHEGLQISKKIKHQEGIASCTGNLASLAIDRKNWSDGETLAREALQISESLGRLESIGMNCQRIAISLLRLDRAQEALPYSRRAVEIFTRLGSPKYVRSAQLTLKACEESVHKNS